jgi:hypothetical protein
MAHYAEGLRAAGCVADLGFVGHHHLASNASAYFGHRAPTEATQEKRAPSEGVALRRFDSWAALSAAASSYDVVMVEKTGADAGRAPTAAMLSELPCASLVLAIFAVHEPHGDVFAPLSSCTEVRVLSDSESMGRFTSVVHPIE